MRSARDHLPVGRDQLEARGRERSERAQAGTVRHLMREAINGRHQSSSVRAPSRARYATGVCGSSATA